MLDERIKLTKEKLESNEFILSNERCLLNNELKFLKLLLSKVDLNPIQE
jgi:hypothetical protein